jgi:hypothetical protein
VVEEKDERVCRVVRLSGRGVAFQGQLHVVNRCGLRLVSGEVPLTMRWPQWAQARPADAVYDALRARRFDVSRLSTRDLLRKDYKQWQMGDTRVGVASVGMDLRAMAAKDAAMADACAHWSDHCGLDLLVVMVPPQTSPGSIGFQGPH